MMNTTFFKTTTLAVTCAALMACGGGGDTPDPVSPSPSPSPSNVTAQGLWQSSEGAATTISTLVTDNGQVWSVLSNAGITRLVKTNLAASSTGFTSAGKAFVLGTTTVDAVTLNAAAVAKSSLKGNISSTTQTEPFSLAYQTRYETRATLIDFAGVTWSATLGSGTVNWSISSSGVITGTRTTGCTYVGQISLRAETKAVADVVVTESCPAVTQLTGVAVKTTDNTGITIMLTTTENTQAVLLGLR